MSVLDSLKVSLRELPPETRPRFVGIYFLISKGVVVYVGKSTDIEQRMIAHWSARNSKNPRTRMRFDEARWLPVDEQDLTAYEGAILRSLAPRYNRIAHPSKRDSEIVELLGLPPIPVERQGAFRINFFGEAKRARAKLRRAARLRKERAATERAS